MAVPVRQLREYQGDAVADTERRHAAGDLALAGSMATGGGKSSVLGQVLVNAVRRGGRALVLAHRTELCDQLAETIASLAPELPIGRIQGGRNVAHRPITVATTNTLGRWDRRTETLPRLEAWLAASDEPVAMVGYDELHHAASPGNRRILARIGCMGPEATVPMLGVSATLTRADRYGLGDIVHRDVAFDYPTTWLIEQGYLVAPRGKVVVADHLDLRKAKITAGDYQDGQLGEMVSQDADQIVQAWLDHADGRVTAGFFPTVESAQKILAAFLERGVPAEIVTGQTPTGDGMFQRGSAERGTGIYGRLCRGETRVLVGVMVTTEGWDAPSVSCILMGRPTRMAHLYQQIVGRGLRPVPAEKVASHGWVAKSDCLVLDVVGASRGQKLTSLIDLVPGASVDLSALDDLPCDTCHKVRCECGKGAGPERTGPPALQGPAFYETFDLLLSEDGAGDRWLATDAGHPVLAPSGLRRFAVILEQSDGRFRVGSVTKRGNPAPELIVADCSLDQARQAAEVWAVSLAPHLAHRNAVWRTRAKGAPSGRDCWNAVRLGIAEPEVYSAAELAELVAVTETSQRMDILGQGAAART